QDETIVLLRARLLERPVHHERVGLLEVIKGLDAPFLGRDQLRLGTCTLDRRAGLRQLDLLNALLRYEESDLLPFEPRHQPDRLPAPVPATPAEPGLRSTHQESDCPQHQRSNEQEPQKVRSKTQSAKD